MDILGVAQMATGTAVLCASVAIIHGQRVKKRITELALQDTTPEQRAPILKALPPVLRTVGSGPRVSLGGKNDELQKRESST